jgi:hypothetical protein
MYKVEWEENGETRKKIFMDYDKAWNFLNSLYLDCLVVGSMLSLNEVDDADNDYETELHIAQHYMK